MRTVSVAALLFAGWWTAVGAHTVGSVPVTWNREISRLVYDKCASCHRPGGVAFSMTTYRDVQPRANEIKDAVLSRRMPPWGAVKGFGSFRNDQSLTQEQIEIFRRWVDGGIRRGNNPRVLPDLPTFAETPDAAPHPTQRITGAFTVSTPVTLDGLVAEQVPAGRSLRIVAALPDGRIEPLVWLHGYDQRYPHPFLFRNALRLPAGTVIRGVQQGVVIGLLAP